MPRQPQYSYGITPRLQQIVVYVREHPGETVKCIAVGMELGWKSIGGQVCALRKMGYLKPAVRGADHPDYGRVYLA